jgi:hypothetical protein
MANYKKEINTIHRKCCGFLQNRAKFYKFSAFFSLFMAQYFKKLYTVFVRDVQKSTVIQNLSDSPSGWRQK